MWTIAAIAIGALAYWMDTRAIKIKACHRMECEALHKGQQNAQADTKPILNAEALCDLLSGLTLQDQARSTFAMNRETLKKVMRLKKKDGDGSGRYLWNPGTPYGLNQTILGHSFIEFEAVPGVLAATRDAVLLVDSSCVKKYKAGTVVHDTRGKRVVKARRKDA